MGAGGESDSRHASTRSRRSCTDSKAASLSDSASGYAVWWLCVSEKWGVDERCERCGLADRCEKCGLAERGDRRAWSFKCDMWAKPEMGVGVARSSGEGGRSCSPTKMSGFPLSSSWPMPMATPALSAPSLGVPMAVGAAVSPDSAEYVLAEAQPDAYAEAAVPQFEAEPAVEAGAAVAAVAATSASLKVIVPVWAGCCANVGWSFATSAAVRQVSKWRCCSPSMTWSSLLVMESMLVSNVVVFGMNNRFWRSTGVVDTIGMDNGEEVDEATRWCEDKYSRASVYSGGCR